MSIESWKEEFYPIPTEDLDDDTAPKQILSKWVGCRKENLEKHELRVADEFLLDKQGFAFGLGGANCYWCRINESKTELSCASRTLYCKGCPAVIAGTYRCDRGDKSPWDMWILNRDPEPMIEWVEEAIGKIEGAAKAVSNG